MKADGAIVTRQGSRTTAGLALALYCASSNGKLAGGGAVPELDLLRVAIALLICIALALVVIFLLRRLHVVRSGKAGTPIVTVLDAARLGPRSRLYVIEFDGKRVLVGADAQGLHRLAESAKGDGEADSSAPAAK